MYKKVVIVCGMPRSGTSWLGQIFDSSPDVAFRMEPLFAYRFKNIINARSSVNDILNFLKEVYLSDDNFINQKENRISGIYPSILKNNDPNFLVIKTTRHHCLLEHYLKLLDNIEIVSIIRNPCAVINSWINTDLEFKEKGCVEEIDWKNGNCRKNGIGEYWGFDDWLSVTNEHLMLNMKYRNFTIIKYTELINNTEYIISNIFKKIGIEYSDQIVNFLKDCHSKHDDNPYSIYKSPNVENKWKKELSIKISRQIISEIKKEGLEDFI